MEQVFYLIMQHADKAAALTGVFALILLTVTLHRIKRLEKTMQKILGRISSQAATVTAAETAKQEDQPATADSRISVSNGQLPSDAAELLDAVLEEVFP